MRLPLLLLLMSVCAVASSLPAVDRYAGTWNLVPSASDDLDRAIEKTIAPMSFVARPIARTRLKRRNYAFPSMLISVDEANVHVRHDGGLDITYPATLAPVKTKAPDGSDLVCRLVPEPVLTLTYESDAGRREDTYVLSSDGSIVTMNVRITSDKLPQALTYKLVYKRSTV